MQGPLINDCLDYATASPSLCADAARVSSDSSANVLLPNEAALLPPGMSQSRLAIPEAAIEHDLGQAGDNDELDGYECGNVTIESLDSDLTRRVDFSSSIVSSRDCGDAADCSSGDLSEISVCNRLILDMGEYHSMPIVARAVMSRLFCSCRHCTRALAHRSRASHTLCCSDFDPQKLHFRWWRCCNKNDSYDRTILACSSDSYQPTCDDLGSFICCEGTFVQSNSSHSETVCALTPRALVCDPRVQSRLKQNNVSQIESINNVFMVLVIFQFQKVFLILYLNHKHK
jgi:hypothetical protein